MDLKDKLREAFATECPELLARIRATLDDLAAGEGAVTPEAWAETFRAAHTLKGAARACDLGEIEGIGSTLQTLIGRARDGALKFSPRDLLAIRHAADDVEDTTTAMRRHQPRPDVSDTFRELAAIESNERTDPPPVEDEADSLDSRLLAAFQAEHQEHLEGMRNIVEPLVGQDRPQLESDALNELFRRAHSIKGAARVNDLRDVEALAHALESFAGRLRDGQLALSDESLNAVRGTLDAIEDAAAAAMGDGRSPDISAELQRLQAFTPEESADAKANSSPIASSPNPATPAPETAPRATASDEKLESLRVDSHSLDRILSTAGALSSACLGDEAMQAEMDEIIAETGRLRPDLDLATALPPAVREHLQFVEQGWQQLTKRLTALRSRQRRSDWQRAGLSRELQADVRKARFIPAAAVFHSFRKMVRDLARDEGREVDVQFTGLEVEADRMVFQTLKEPVMHLLRNAVSHGVEAAAERRRQGKPEAGRVGLHVASLGHRLELRIEDDGPGIDVKRVGELAQKRGLISASEAAAKTAAELRQLIFHPNFSTSRVVSEVSGRGMGMSIVQAAVTRLGGEIEIHAGRHGGTEFRIEVPLSLATQKLIMIRCQERQYGIPFGALEGLIRIDWNSVRQVEGRLCMWRDEDTIPLTGIEQLLGVASAPVSRGNGFVYVAVLRGGGRKLAVIVDEFIGALDTVMKDLPPPARGNPGVNGAIITEDGGVALVLNPIAFLRNFRPETRAQALPAARGETPEQDKEAPTILVVDDSFTTRTLEKNLLESEGYKVLIAVDGMEGLNRLRNEHVDLTVSDIEMPRMDGFALLEEIKKDEAIRSTPVILMSSLENNGEIQRGLDLGAEAYIVKRKFDHHELLDTIKQFL